MHFTGPSNVVNRGRLLGLLMLSGILVAIACGQGEESVATLIGNLSSTEVEVRRRAAGRLEKHGPAAAAGVPALVRCLSDSDKYVRGFAARTLGAIGPSAQSAAPALANVMLSDTLASTRSAAARSLGLTRVESSEIAEKIVAAVETGKVHWQTASEALDLMGRAGAAASARIDDPSLLVRLAMDYEDIGALEHLKLMPVISPLVVPSLVALLKQPKIDPELRDLAVGVLSKIGPDALDAVEVLELLAANGNAEAKSALSHIRRR